MQKVWALKREEKNIGSWQIFHGDKDKSESNSEVK